MTSGILYLVSYTVYSFNVPGRHNYYYFPQIFQQHKRDFGRGNVAMHYMAVLVGFQYSMSPPYNDCIIWYHILLNLSLHIFIVYMVLGPERMTGTEAYCCSYIEKGITSNQWLYLQQQNPTVDIGILDTNHTTITIHPFLRDSRVYCSSQHFSAFKSDHLVSSCPNLHQWFTLLGGK